jgi:hypothetical protein
MVLLSKQIFFDIPVKASWISYKLGFGTSGKGGDAWIFS